MSELGSLVPFLPVLFLAAIGAGLIAGLLGAGGGIVIVPILYYVMGGMEVADAVRMHTAVGTSLAVIIATSSSSVYSHYRQKAVDVAVLRDWGPLLIGGAILGTVLARILSADLLTLVFGLFALLFAVQMGLDAQFQSRSSRLPTGSLKCFLVGGNGLISALLGIGGGMIGVTTLMYYGYSIHRAIATAAGFGLLISLPGAAGFMIAGWGEPGRLAGSLGFVNTGLFLSVAPLTVLSAPAGASLAHRFDRTSLRRIFAVLMGIIAIQMITDVLL